MKWSEMAAVQRDVLVHEKVMGETKFICTGKLVYDGNNTKYMHHYYVCQECKVRLTVTSSYLEKCKPPTEHNKLIPQYTTDMNAAWQVIQRLVKLYGDDTETNFDMYWQKNEFFQAMNLEPYFEAKRDEMGITLAQLAVWTPERICLAALRTCNVEVSI